MDGRNAASSIIGFVNGFGTIGTFVQGPLIGVISDNFGFTGMFYAMIVLSLLGSITSYRAHRLYEIRKKHRVLVHASDDQNV